MEQMTLLLQGDPLINHAKPYQYPIELFQIVFIFIFVNIEYYDNVYMSHL